MKKFLKITVLILALCAFLASCEKELTAEEKAARFTYPDPETSGDYKTGDTIEKDNIIYTVKKDDTLAVTSYKGDELSLTIPEKVKGLYVTEIGEGAFKESYNVSYVTIPNRVTRIGDEAFYNCVNLINIMGAEGVRSVGAHCFTGTAAAAYSDEDFVVVGGILIAYKGSDTNVVIPDGVRIISTAFANRADISSVTIPKSVKVIGESAFEGATSIKALDLTSSVIRVEDRAFYGCTSLESIYIPYSVSEFGEDIFDGCSENLTAQCAISSAGELYCMENNIKILG